VDHSAPPTASWGVTQGENFARWPESPTASSE